MIDRSKKENNVNWTTIKDGRGNTYVTPLPEPRKVAYGTEIATHVVKWYNRTTRDWVVSLSNKVGDQVGSSEYVYSQDDANATAQWLIDGGTI